MARTNARHAACSLAVGGLPVDVDLAAAIGVW
jgi:hypothetical protein